MKSPVKRRVPLTLFSLFFGFFSWLVGVLLFVFLMLYFWLFWEFDFFSPQDDDLADFKSYSMLMVLQTRGEAVV